MRVQRLIAPALTVALLGAAALALLLTRGSDGARSLSLAPTPTEPAPSPTTASTASPSPSPTATAIPTATSTPVPPPPSEPRAQPPAGAPRATEPPPIVDEWSDPGFAARVFALVNAERTARGLPALVSNEALTRSSTEYAHTLLRLGALSHGADGSTLVGRVQLAGYSGGPPLGEVLWMGVGHVPPERVVSDWLNSPSHRDVILSAAYGEGGVGCYFEQGERLESRCAMDLAA